MLKNIDASKSLLSVAGATGLLLRLEMEGINVGDRWKRLPDMRCHAGVLDLPFSDCHLSTLFMKRGEVDLERKTYDSLVNQIK